MPMVLGGYFSLQTDILPHHGWVVVVLTIQELFGIGCGKKVIEIVIKKGSTVS
jgi:hypothetical protein